MQTPSQSSVAASVRRHKESHPWAYCAHPGCLWRTETRKGYSPCRKHNAYATPEARAEQRAAVLMGTDLPRDRDGVICGHTEFETDRRDARGRGCGAPREGRGGGRALTMLTHTQYCVLRVAQGNGGAIGWRQAKQMVALRSGRTVRPNASTLKSMREAGLVSIYGGDVWMTGAGRAALAAAASRKGVSLADTTESLVRHAVPLE